MGRRNGKHSSMEHDAALEDRRHLATYLRDHHAGSSAGLSLVKRCRAANVATAWEPLLTDLESEIAADRRALDEIMRRLGIAPSAVKSTLGSVAELASRLKANGHLVRYSPLSRLVELEILAAGIFTKRNLWRSLREVAGHHEGLHRPELDDLIDGAASQLERILEGHRRAAIAAFGGSVRELVAG